MQLDFDREKLIKVFREFKKWIMNEIFLQQESN